MARYSVLMQRTASATLAVGSVNAAAANPQRLNVDYLSFGCEAAPGDFAYLLQVQKSTTVGTATAVTPVTLDGAAAAISTGASNHTVDPTLTAGAMVLTVPVHQKASFQWYGPPGRELVIPSTAVNGLAVRTPTAVALVAVTATVHFFEG